MVHDAYLAEVSSSTAHDFPSGTSAREVTEFLVPLDRRLECLKAWQGRFSEEDANWLAGRATAAMDLRDLWLAGEYAHLLAALRWGSPWYPRGNRSGRYALPFLPAEVFLTAPKLQHDIEQFLHLQRRGVLGPEFASIIAAYRELIDRLTAQGAVGQVSLDDEAQSTIGHVFNRIVYLHEAPRLARAFSNEWNPAAVEREYLGNKPGVVVIDNFLSPEALESLRIFCIESTVWSGNRYAHGRLGAFFHDGFNCPLLLQIAEDLRYMMPRVIGDRHPLRQLWGFKNDHFLPGDSTTHADFAAVNVNFWITPTECNLDPNSGGLVVYGVDAPLDWSFHMYNGRPDLIKSFLQRHQAKSMTIPYRENRAIFFNSDLFHASGEVRFRPGYQNRRVNITMLYGERCDDIHHRELSKENVSAGTAAAPPAWRSKAFSRARGSRR